MERQQARTEILNGLIKMYSKGENVLLFGASGLGKSHLAAAVVEGVVNQGDRARFYSAGGLLQELRKARSLLRLNEVLLKGLYAGTPDFSVIPVSAR
ncbi:hypothetical protein SME10J_41120 [Serratia marcescens]|nr:hypothetical protein SME10J_41120 [Serratia marcescens]